MECQSTVVLGAAPASVATADISASPSQVGWPRFSREARPQGSQPAFAGRHVVRGGLTFYPPDYGTALACSLIPPPLSHRSALARDFPLLLGVRGWENNRVATFHRCTRVDW